MNDDEELNPDVARALRDVPPASDALQEAHIAAALEEIVPTRRIAGRRSRLLSAVSAIAVIAGAIALFAGQDKGVSPLNPNPSTTTIAKTGGSPDCADEFSGLWGDSRWLTEITRNGRSYAVIQRNGALAVFANSEPCDKKGELDYWATLDALDTTSDSMAADIEMCDSTLNTVAEYNDRANGEPRRIVVIATSDGVELRLWDKCRTSLGALSLP